MSQNLAIKLPSFSSGKCFNLEFYTIHINYHLFLYCSTAKVDPSTTTGVNTTPMVVITHPKGSRIEPKSVIFYFIKDLEIGDVRVKYKPVFNISIVVFLPVLDGDRKVIPGNNHATNKP